MTAVTLRPNTTLSSPTGTVTGAATAHAALADNSDASYVAADSGVDSSGAFPYPYDYTEVGFETVTLPTGAVVKSVQLRLRGKGATGTFTDQWMGYEGSGALPFAASVNTTSSTIVTSSGSLRTVSLSQAQLDGLTMQVGALNSSHAAGMNFYAAYIDVVYVTIPVVTVTAVSPDPYTASNIVPIAWVNTLDAAGGSQTKYELKVFTDAQYGAGGFDPDTSTPYYESGVVIGSATTANTSVLQDADTYRAYVRVAQTVNGVDHWGDWDYDQFTVDVSTADVNTVTPVATNSTALITVTVARDTGTPAWDYIEVERSFDSGTTWLPVRGATYVAPDSANSHVVIDYETGNGQDTLYRARATRIVSGETITGEWTEASSEVAWTSTSSWLKAPNDPTLNLALVTDTPFSNVEYPVRHGVYDIVGSDKRVVISDVVSSRSSSLAVLTDTDTGMADLLALLRALVLYWCPSDCDGGTGEGVYVAVTGIAQSTVTKRAHLWRSWNVSYVVVDAPGDPDASAP